MTLRVELNALVPRLRRYARALLTGSPAPSDDADDLVKQAITEALARAYPETGRELLLRLLTHVTLLSRNAGHQAVSAFGWPPRIVCERGERVDGTQPPVGSKLARGLLALTTEQREALLLVTLERCDYGEAARILRLSRATLVHRLTQARTSLDAALQTRTAERSMSRRAAPYLRVVS